MLLFVGWRHDDGDGLFYDLMTFVQVNDSLTIKHSNIWILIKLINVRPNINVLPSVTATVDLINIQAEKFIKLPPRYDKNEPLCFNCFTYGHVFRTV